MAKAKPCRAECSFSSDSSANSTFHGLDLSSIVNTSFFESSFMDSLASFMHEASVVIDRVREQANAPMTEQERQRKMQELMQRIAEKEKELSQLEAERRGMLSNYDASVSTSGGGSGFSPPRSGVRTLPASPIPQSTTYQSSLYDCDDSCDAECSNSEDTSASYSRYMSPSRGATPMPVQYRATSSPVRIGTRPPDFSSSEYTPSCVQDCTEPCQQSSMDSTMKRWHRQLGVRYR